MSQYDHILLGHGSGGQLTADLIQRLFVPAFGNDVLAALEDQATVNSASATTAARRRDRVHDRLVRGPAALLPRRRHRPAGGARHGQRPGGRRCRPLFLSAAFILEEGLPLADLQRIVASMRRACDEAGVALVTGDTKVVDRGKGDGSSSPPPASAWCRRAARCRSAPPGPATASSSRGRSATTASPSCRCARGWSSRRCWKATRPR